MPNADRIISLALMLLVSMGVLAEENSKLDSLLAKSEVMDKPTYNQLDTLYRARLQAPSPEVAELIRRSTAAGLLLIGRKDVYESRIRKSLRDVGDFERDIRDSCNSCEGTANARRTCPKCQGQRRCINKSCDQGVIRSAAGRNARTCSVCQGHGVCLTCRGVGVQISRCGSCKGRGTRLSKRATQEVYAQGLSQAREKLAAINYAKQVREAELAAIASAAKESAVSATRTDAQQLIAQRQEASMAAKDNIYLASTVLVQGDMGTGSGFLARYLGRTVVISNAHVFCGNSQVRLLDANGREISFNRIMVHRDNDLALFMIPNPGDRPKLNVSTKVDLALHRRIGVYGNSGGEQVVTVLRGKVLGIGPHAIEIDADFIQGNSGSPVIDYSSGEVIGVATYMTNEPSVDWTTRRTRFAQVRRFGVRLDTATMNDYVTVDMTRYRQQLAQSVEMAEFAVRALNSAVNNEIGVDNRAIATARMHLNRYGSFPEWFQRFNETAMGAAVVCELIINAR